ncbi:MAG: hypothetical protein C4K49_06670 [Candidatus Thorarchaeota archaeon]|nr:MAG: hypothetical protein C4K49_06670 [Candidatus Thorarchaeota archaeon]
MLWIVFAVFLAVGLGALTLDYTSNSVRNGRGSKKCYTDASSIQKIYCSKVVDSGYFPMESEDCAEAYAMGKRYSGA